MCTAPQPYSVALGGAGPCSDGDRRADRRMMGVHGRADLRRRCSRAGPSDAGTSEPLCPLPMRLPVNRRFNGSCAHLGSANSSDRPPATGPKPDPQRPGYRRGTRTRRAGTAAREPRCPVPAQPARAHQHRGIENPVGQPVAHRVADLAAHEGNQQPGGISRLQWCVRPLGVGAHRCNQLPAFRGDPAGIRMHRNLAGHQVERHRGSHLVAALRERRMCGNGVGRRRELLGSRHSHYVCGQALITHRRGIVAMPAATKPAPGPPSSVRPHGEGAHSCRHRPCGATAPAW